MSPEDKKKLESQTDTRFAGRTFLTPVAKDATLKYAIEKALTLRNQQPRPKL